MVVTSGGQATKRYLALTNEQQMTVRAKCRVTGRHEFNSVNGEEITQVEVTLQPVFGQGDEDANSQWSRWTPSGELRLTITNPEAYNQFQRGKTYYVDFSPAE